MLLNNKLLFALLINFSAKVICGQELTAEEITVKLPQKLDSAASVYDGKDSIYLIGGNSNSDVRAEILKYSLTDQTVTEIAKLPFPSYLGSAVIDNRGENIYYFAGSTKTAQLSDIIQINLETKSVTVAGNLNTRTFAHKAVKFTNVYNSSKAYIIGGYRAENLIQCWDMDVHSTCPTKTMDTGFFHEATVSYGNEAFVFGDTNNTVEGDPIYRINLETFQTSFGPRILPQFTYYPAATRVGSDAYLIGGWINHYTDPGNVIYKIDLNTLEPTKIIVEGFLDALYNDGVSVEYVEKQNKIYLFGGYHSGFGRQDKIWSIDLPPVQDPSTTTSSPPTSSTLDPSLFTCDDKADGFYPNPTDCAQFISCRDDGQTEYYTCPYPLLFNPVKATCDFPSEVNCEISCVDKPNGLYPHPQDCALFIGCLNSAVNVFRCPQPLLFDPVEAKCNFPESVDCKVQ